ncbi:hypothetical protein M9H77_17132 [Catharanthus roseus]|uniref:Uncharacterized protein n=1 Tax=Catharanthus roseus TaxID=4058 RepID=A0ACC0B3Q7_CATRO|nr:hypothetical protein M9H77_17132 [Catharanthus roseus]
MLGSGDTGGGKENMGRESSLESSSVFGDFNVEMQKVNVKGEGSSLGLLEVLVQVGTVGKVKGKGVHGVKVVEVVHGPVKQPSREITMGGNFSVGHEDVRVRGLVLDPNSVDFLSQPFTAKEVQATLKEMHPTKSLGPDSFHALFYQ